MLAMMLERFAMNNIYDHTEQGIWRQTLLPSLSLFTSLEHADLLCIACIAGNHWLGRCPGWVDQHCPLAYGYLRIQNDTVRYRRRHLVFEYLVAMAGKETSLPYTA